MSEQMVSLNEVVNLVKELSRGDLKQIIGGIGPKLDCDSRCGCKGGDCGCFNQVSGVWDRLSWVEFKAMRDQKVRELKQQLDMLEQDDGTVIVRQRG